MKALFALLLVPVAAHAWQFEAGVGRTSYSVQPDGTWYQAGLPHNLNTHSVAFTAGVTGELWRGSRFGLAWHAGYVFLGNASATCDCTEWDRDYSIAQRRQITPGAPHAQFNGHGNMQGVAVTLEPYAHYGAWRLGVEGGVFAFRPQWDEVVHADMEGTVILHTPNRLKFGPVVGVSVSRGAFTIGYRHYWLPTNYSNASPPSLMTGADVLMLTYKF